jgi:hypothetical protein
MKCEFTKDSGEQCNANAMNGNDFCYLHNPAISDEEKKEAQMRGGQNRARVLKEPLPEVDIKTSKDAVLLLADTISRVRAGTMDAKIATTLGYLSGHLIKAFEISEMEDRFDKLEQVVEDRFK